MLVISCSVLFDSASKATSDMPWKITDNMMQFAPMAAIALCLLTFNVAAARAQSPLIEELVHKAERSEAEDGFCARSQWPAGDSSDDFAAFLRSAVEKSWRVSTFSTGACVYNLVTAVKPSGGDRCVSYTYYTCARGGVCGVGKSIDCVRPDGTYTRRSD
jgi:hypothetical protein